MNKYLTYLSVFNRHASVIKRVMLIAIVVLAVYVAAVIWVLPGFIIKLAAEQVQQQLGRKLTIEQFSLNPMTLAARAKGVRLYESDNSTLAIGIDELLVNVSTGSIVRLAPVLDEISVTKPVIRVVRTAPNTLNYTDIIEKILAKPASPEPALFSLNNIRVQGGRIDLKDDVKNKTIAVTDIELGIPFVSNFPRAVKISVQPSLSAKIDGSPFKLGGSTQPFSSTLDSTLDLVLNQFKLSELNAYLPPSVSLSFPQGTLSTHLQVRFRQPAAHKQELLVSGTLGLKDLEIVEGRVGDTNKPLYKMGSLDLALKGIDLTQRDLVIDSLTIDKPQVWVSRNGKGALNWLGLFKASPPAANTPVPAQASTPGAASAPWRVRLKQVALTHGALDWADSASSNTPSANFSTRVTDLTMALSNLDTQSDTPATLELSAQGDVLGTFKHTGTIHAKTLAAKGEWSLEGMRLKPLMPYAQSLITPVIKDGSISLQGAYQYAAASAEAPQLIKVSLTRASLDQLKLVTSDAKPQRLLNIGQLAFSGSSLDMMASRFELGDVSLKQLEVDVIRQPDGINLAQLLKPVPPSAPQTAFSSTQMASTPPVKSAVSATLTAPVPLVTVNKLTVEKSRVQWTDNAAPEPVSLLLSDLSVQASNLSSMDGKKFPLTVSATVNKTGQLKTSGDVTVAPLRLAQTIQMTNVPVAFAQGYLADALNIRLQDAAVSGKLQAAVQALPATKAGADGGMKIGVKGSVDVNNLASTDKVLEADLLRWKALNLKGLDVQLNPGVPMALGIDEIALSDFYARVIVSNAGRVNLQDIVVSAKPAAGTGPVAGSASAAPQASGAPGSPTIRLGQITLVNGNVNFTDNFIRPNYTANLTDLTGRISGFSSTDPQPATVQIKGSVDGDGALDISGQVNPLAKPLFLDIAAQANDIELTRLTPYAVKYAGYAIEKGKLSTKVKYRIVDNKLDAENNLFLDQLTFGEKVDSPDATKLPVLLAISLLKNSRGEIDLNLPVSGSLSDPQFSIGGIVVKVIMNVITKALTAPFSLLTSAFGGGGEELAYVEFAPGASLVSEASRSKVATLVKALADRPALKLEVVGRADPALDTDGLRRARLQRKMQAAKFKELGKDAGAASIDDVRIESAERAKWLEKVYSAEKFPKPKNLIGLAKSLPPEQMENLIITNTVITPEDLRQLALSRASEIRAVIEASGKVAPERLFLVAPRLTAEGIEDKGKTTRVDFVLK